MELYLKVRLACRDGMSAREAARQFGISCESVKKMLSFSVPPGYRRTAPIKRPKLDGFTEIIDQWLGDDVGQHRKQRHTAKRVFDRLRDEHGFTGGYTIVKDYVRAELPHSGAAMWPGFPPRLTHHTISRTRAAAALPSVIGGPGADFMNEVRSELGFGLDCIRT